MEMTGDARPGAIVETRSWQDARGNTRLSLAMRSDLTLAEQVAASGATWLDRELIAREPVAAGTGFGLEIREAMEARYLHLEGARSEEHTSELQSLMRTPYAVFCLKQKNYYHSLQSIT